MGIKQAYELEVTISRILHKLLVPSALFPMRLEVPDKEGVAAPKLSAEGLCIAVPKRFTFPNAARGSPKKPLQFRSKRVVEPNNGIRFCPNKVLHGAIVTVHNPPRLCESYFYTLPKVGCRRPVRTPMQRVKFDMGNV